MRREKKMNGTKAVVRRKNNRIDFSIFDDQKCIVMAHFGQFASTIQEATGLTTAQVYYRCEKRGVKLTDYRRGKGPFGAVLFSHFTVTSKGLDEKNQIQKLFGMANGKLQLPSG